MSKHYPLRVGLFGIGLEAYWPQFEGLKPRLEGYLSQVISKLRSS
jgi:L-arabinose isomerase